MSSIPYKKTKRPTVSDDCSLSEDGDNHSRTAKSSLLSDFRANVTKNAKSSLETVRHKVSQQRGRIVNVMYKRFPTFSPTMSNMNNGFAVSPHFTTDSPSEAYPPLYPQLRAAWYSLSARKVAEDLHRLVSRITVRSSGVFDLLLAPPTADKRKTDTDIARALVNLVEVLVKRLDRQRASEILGFTQQLLEFTLNLASQKLDSSEEDETEQDAVPEKLDLIEFTLKILEYLGPHSPVYKLLKTIHQSIILRPYSILRTLVVKQKLTKDVRTEDGWSIILTLAQEGFVQAKHIRKEQSIDVPTVKQPNKEKNHWEYQWEVSMTFDERLNDMTSCRLSITDLVLSEGMDPSLIKELTDIFQNGNLIVF